jgi:hypothetical protein
VEPKIYAAGGNQKERERERKGKGLEMGMSAIRKEEMERSGWKWTTHQKTYFH